MVLYINGLQIIKNLHVLIHLGSTVTFCVYASLGFKQLKSYEEEEEVEKEEEEEEETQFSS